MFVKNLIDTLCQESVHVPVTRNELDGVFHGDVAQITWKSAIGVFHKFVHHLKSDIGLRDLVEKSNLTFIEVVILKTRIFTEIMPNDGIDTGVDLLPFNL